VLRLPDILWISLLILLMGCQPGQTPNGDMVTPDSCPLGVRPYAIRGSIDLPQVSQIPHSDNPDSLIVYLQRRADHYAWETFIAMNWPALPDGSPDSLHCLGNGEATTVWEHWIPGPHIYRPNGEEPLPWPDSVDKNGVPVHLRDPHLLHYSGKDPDFTRVDADDIPLIDQDSILTQYQITYNRVAYDYIRSSGLYSEAGQQNFVKNYPDFTKGLYMVIKGDTANIERTFERAYFPVGNVKDSIQTNKTRDTVFYFEKGEGAIIIKSAWKRLAASDDASTFHTRELTLENGPWVKIGLVGLHFMHKIAEATQWGWATFEHINNVPELDSNGMAILDHEVDYTYFNELEPDSARYNTPSPYNLITHLYEKIPIQVVRSRPIYASALKTNQLFHERIRKADPNSVWLNYQLVGAQWPLVTDFFTHGADYQPAKLGNPVMETYFQNTASCMDCHKSARFYPYGRDSTAFNSDFIFSLSRAR